MYLHPLPSGKKIRITDMLKVSPACQTLNKKEFTYLKKRILALPEKGQKQVAEALLKEKEQMETIGRKLDRTVLRMDVLEGKIRQLEKEMEK